MAASRFWMERSLMVVHRKLTKSKNVLKFGIIRGKKVPLKCPYRCKRATREKML